MHLISQINALLPLIIHAQKNKKLIVKIHYCFKIEKFLYFLIEEGFINGFTVIRPWQACLHLKYDRYGKPAIRILKKFAFQNMNKNVKAERLDHINKTRIGTLILNTSWGITTDHYAYQKHIGGRLVALVY
jgi:ribosomal protein S8